MENNPISQIFRVINSINILIENSKSMDEASKAADLFGFEKLRDQLSALAEIQYETLLDIFIQIGFSTEEEVNSVPPSVADTPEAILKLLIERKRKIWLN